MSDHFCRVLHSELLSEILSRVSSRNEFSRVGTSSEKARITRPNPNFQKTPITETRENENFGKNHLSQGPTFLSIKAAHEHVDESDPM